MGVSLFKIFGEVFVDDKQALFAMNNIDKNIWKQRGFISFCEGSRVNYSDVTNWFVGMFEIYDLRPLWVYYDPWNSQYWMQEMEQHGFEMVKCRQGFQTLSSPMKELASDLHGKLVNYNNNPILKWCLTNTAVRRDVNDNIMPDKGKNQKQRIDGTASLVDAYVGLIEHYSDLITYHYVSPTGSATYDATIGLSMSSSGGLNANPYDFNINYGSDGGSGLHYTRFKFSTGIEFWDSVSKTEMASFDITSGVGNFLTNGGSVGCHYVNSTASATFDSRLNSSGLSLVGSAGGVGSKQYKCLIGYEPDGIIDSNVTRQTVGNSLNLMLEAFGKMFKFLPIGIQNVDGQLLLSAKNHQYGVQAMNVSAVKCSQTFNFAIAYNITGAGTVMTASCVMMDGNYDQGLWWNVSAVAISATQFVIRGLNVSNVYGSSIQIAWTADGS